MGDDDFRTVPIGPTKRRERQHVIARQSREPNKIIVRFLSVLEEVLPNTPIGHCFNWFHLARSCRVVSRLSVLIHSLAVNSSQAATLVV
jgi:hypothetical protein